jgi:hypothetical protein
LNKRQQYIFIIDNIHLFGNKRQQYTFKQKITIKLNPNWQHTLIFSSNIKQKAATYIYNLAVTKGNNTLIII